MDMSERNVEVPGLALAALCELAEAAAHRLNDDDPELAAYLRGARAEVMTHSRVLAGAE